MKPQVFKTHMAFLEDHRTVFKNLKCMWTLVSYAPVRKLSYRKFSSYTQNDCLRMSKQFCLWWQWQRRRMKERRGKGKKQESTEKDKRKEMTVDVLDREMRNPQSYTQTLRSSPERNKRHRAWENSSTIYAKSSYICK